MRLDLAASLFLMFALMTVCHVLSKQVRPSWLTLGVVVFSSAGALWALAGAIETVVRMAKS